VSADLIRSPEWQYDVMLAVGRALNSLTVRVDQFEIDVQDIPVVVRIERFGPRGDQVSIRTSHGYSNDPLDPRPDGRPASFSARLPRKWLELAFQQTATFKSPYDRF
jgi:hypothetical protein